MNEYNTTTTTHTNHQYPPPSPTKQKKRKRILLGITGSVAAIKGPELALQLSKELDAHVVILLTQGGEHFWYKAKDYNPMIWQEFYRILLNHDDLVTTKKEEEGCDCDCDGRRRRRRHVQQQNHCIVDDPKGRCCCDRDQDDDDKGRIQSSSVYDAAKLPHADDDETRSIVLFHAQDEWKGWNQMSDPVLHIQLRDWADIAIVAPLSAHTLAKIATGLCDDTLTCVLRAWDFGQRNILQQQDQQEQEQEEEAGGNSSSSSRQGGKPLVLAPAMNTAMWDHPLTGLHLETIRGFYSQCRNLEKIDNHGTTTTTTTTTNSNHNDSYKDEVVWMRIAEPQVKTLACGEIGKGAMASVDCIVHLAQELLQQEQQQQQQQQQQQYQHDDDERK